MSEAREEELFEELRPKAFGVAYRLLGSVSEAEDVVQEGFLRLHRALDDGERIESPEAYLVTVVTRLGIDELRSARARREVYVGEWLPEPILTAEDDDPARHLEIAESLSVGLLMVLETLTPEERAAFLLHEVFDYPHSRIAEILGKSDAAARQLAVRARRRVGEREPRFETSREQRERLVHRFVEAFEEGNLEALEGMLAADVTMRGDGGGKAPALARAIHGRSRVARTLRAFSRAVPRFGVAAVREVDVNGEPGIVAVDGDGRLVTVIAVEISRGQIQAVNSVANPDKLAHLGPVADLTGMVADARERGPIDAGPGRD
ncbi:MAG TPA: RNA polymerase sigma-70 factor [Solirubrobacterales bacterium]|nr:RNA polymerase sigma-70 factor [Solirubrobacterales bacterium]